jgi:flagellin-like protein
MKAISPKASEEPLIQASFTRVHSAKRAISPVVAITILILMTIAAAAMAYLTIVGYQEQAGTASQSGVESLTGSQIMLRIESVAEGDIYLRNLATNRFTGAKFYLDGAPLETAGPGECVSGQVCVFVVSETLNCSGTHELSMGRDVPIPSRTVTCCDLGFCGGEEYTLSLESEETWTSNGYMDPVGMLVKTGSGPKILTFGGDSFGSNKEELRVYNKTGGSFLQENVTELDQATYGEITGYGLAAGDLDNDGSLEIVTATGRDSDGSTNITIFNYTAQGVQVENITFWRAYYTSKFVYIADLDDDGQLELADIGYQYSSPLTLYVGVWNYTDFALERDDAGLNPWVWPDPYGNNIYSPSGYAGDVDNDGDTEFIFTRASCLTLCGYDPCCLGHLTITQWVDGVGFTEEYDDSTIANSALYTTSADVDNDSDKELLVIGSVWDGSKYVIDLLIYRWDGATMTLEHEETWSDTQSSYGRGVKAGDVDGDGKIEIVTAGTMTSDGGGYGEIRTWYWDGTTLSLESATEVGTSAHEYVPWAMELYDIDSDGKLEILNFGEDFSDFILQAWSVP